MNVYEIYRLVNYIADKDFSGNTLKPDDYNLLLEVVNINLFELEFENMVAVSQRENKPMDKIIYDSKGLRRFIVNVVLNSSNDFSYFPLESNYRENIAIYEREIEGEGSGSSPVFVRDKKRIELVSFDEFTRRNENILSLYIPDHPIAFFEFNGSHFQMYPRNILQVNHVYLREPTKPSFAYTIDSLGRIVYDSAGSVQLDWYEWMHYKFTMLVLKEMGINLRENQVIEYAQLEVQNHSK